MSLLYVSVIINLIIDPYLTFRKEVYYKIREILEEVEISANNKISIS